MSGTYYRIRGRISQQNTAAGVFRPGQGYRYLRS